MYYDSMMGYGNSWLWIIMMVLVPLLVVGVILLIVHLVRTNDPITHKNAPVDIAKARYASGELTKAEFDQIKKDLSH